MIVEITESTCQWKWKSLWQKSSNISYLDILCDFRKPQKEERSYVLNLRLNLAVLFFTVITLFSQNRNSLGRTRHLQEGTDGILKYQFIKYSQKLSKSITAEATGSTGQLKCKVDGKINNHKKSIAPHKKILTIIIRFWCSKCK